MLTPRRFSSLLALCLAATVGAAFVALQLGSETISLKGLYSGLDPDRQLLLAIRLPRILLGMVVGLALGSAGAALQGLLRNPLADPYILGIASGAALGYMIGYALHLPFALIPLLAFGSSLVSMAIVFRLSLVRGRLVPPLLLLTGVVYNAFTFALILVVNFLWTGEQSQNVLLLLIGSLGPESYPRIGGVALLVLACWFGLTLTSRSLNIISQSHEEALTLGVPVARVRAVVFILTSLMVGVVVSVAGLIGFVGLFVPHIARFIFGADHRVVIPASGLLGAAALVIADALGRSVLVQSDYMTELPVGAVTALIGGPFFLWLLFREKRRW